MMRSVFSKIFLWFWLAMTMIGATVVILALTTNTEGESHEQRQRRYRTEAQQLLLAYHDAGAAGFRRQRLQLEEKNSTLVYLLHNDGEPLIPEAVPTALLPLVRQAAQSHVTQVQSGEHEIWIAYPATDYFVYLQKRRRPSALTRVLNPRALGLRMAITFIVAGIVCYLLARSLTAPIARLRRATRAFAAGALSTRVSPQIHGRDEITALAGDFDQMAERVEDLVKNQHRLLRDISHELRSPLTRLSIALEIARQRSTPETGPMLERIAKESARLNNLIDQLLGLTLPENATDEISRTPFDLVRLVSEIVDDADFEARGKGRRVRLTAEGPVALAASPELLRQAIENVVRNAVRYTEPDTEVVVSVRKTRQGDGDWVQVAVRDHGPGVAEPALEKIFLPLFRAESARDRQTGGTGLGLAITKRAVHLHRGRVTASNAPGGGLLIEISLPLTTVAALPAAVGDEVIPPTATA